MKLVVFMMLTFPLPPEAAVMPPEPVIVPKPPVSVLVAENATEPPAAALSVTLPFRMIVPAKLEPPAAASAVVPPRVVGPAVALTVIGRSISKAPPVTRAAGLPAELASPIVTGVVAMPNGLA